MTQYSPPVPGNQETSASVEEFGYRSAGQCSGLQAGGEGPRGSTRQGASVP